MSEKIIDFVEINRINRKRVKNRQRIFESFCIEIWRAFSFFYINLSYAVLAKSLFDKFPISKWPRTELPFPSALINGVDKTSPILIRYLRFKFFFWAHLVTLLPFRNFSTLKEGNLEIKLIQSSFNRGSRQDRGKLTLRLSTGL